jgi:lipoic acid synthetase
VLRVRYLGRVGYEEAWDLQRFLARGPSKDDYVLLLEHPHVITIGNRGKREHVLDVPQGVRVIAVDRGGDVTYHGPGQVVGYVVRELRAPEGPRAHVHALEEVVLRTLARFGVSGVRLPGYPGVWVETKRGPEKIGALGVRVAGRRTYHGFALNVSPDLSMFGAIVPCGIADKGVTSLAALGVRASVAEVARAAAEAARDVLGRGKAEIQGAWRQGGSRVVGVSSRVESRLARAGVATSGAVPLRSPKPSYLKVPLSIRGRFLSTAAAVRANRLSTVCEEASCPNIYDCWGAGTATFLINGRICTRACSFCDVTTGRPLAIDDDEPERLVRAVRAMGLSHVVITSPARDDLPDGGASGFVRCVEALKRALPSVTVEVLIPDFQGDKDALEAVLSARPDVINHNIETVLRLQKAVRSRAGYARSLALLARAKAAGAITKSGLIVGMGEEPREVEGALADLRAAGVDIVTVGQYLRPSASHVPVARYWRPEEFRRLARLAESLGFAAYEIEPLARSSYVAGTTFARAAKASSVAGRKEASWISA